MDKGNKNEKAGATTPATPSKVEGTQASEAQVAREAQVDKLQADLTARDSEILSLKEELSKKSEHVATLESEHQAFKDKLKPEIERIQAENKDLKAEVERIQAENKDLKAEVEKLQGELAKPGSNKTQPAKTEGKFTVVNSFRGNKEGEGVYNVGDDVSHLSDDRLKSLVERDLVKEG